MVIKAASTRSPTNKGWAGLWNARAPHPPHTSGSDDSRTLWVASLTEEKQSAKHVVASASAAAAAAAAGPPTPEGPGWKRSSNGQQLLSINSGRVAPVSDHGAAKAPAPAATATVYALRVSEPGGPTAWIKSSGNRRASEPGGRF